MIHHFETDPPIGTVIALDGQSYVLVASEPYRRRDGADVRLLTWHTECAQCSAPFTVQSGLAVEHFNRRCVKHKRPGSRVNRSRPRGEALEAAIFVPAADGTLVPFKGA